MARPKAPSRWRSGGDLGTRSRPRKGELELARGALAFVCQSCGTAHPKWSGRCDDCGAWNTLIEEQAAPPAGASARRVGKARPFVLEGLSSAAEELPRADRCRGIGPCHRRRVGRPALLGGDPGWESRPGVQVLAAHAGAKTRRYVSGEEALAQRAAARREWVQPSARSAWHGDPRRGHPCDSWQRRLRPTSWSSTPSRPSDLRPMPRPAPSLRCAPPAIWCAPNPRASR
jgi:hypothetical protein